MKIEINLDSDEKIYDLANLGFSELLSLPKSKLIKPLLGYSSHTIDLLAKSGCLGLIDFPEYLSLKDKRDKSILAKLLDSLENNEIDILVKKLGFDYVKQDSKALVRLAKRGYAGIMELEESYVVCPDSKYSPIFHLLENCYPEDYDKIFSDRRVLVDYSGDIKDLKENYKGYPIYYLRKNGRRPTFNQIKKYFKIDKKIHHNRKFDSIILSAILQTSKSLRFIMES